MAIIGGVLYDRSNAVLDEMRTTSDKTDALQIVSGPASSKKEDRKAEVMKVKTINLLASALTLGMCAKAAAQQAPPSNQQIDPGKVEYLAHCATCHGLSGAGDGPLSSYLNKTMPNLTTLSTRNGGVFPFARVYETIDGRREVGAHGPRDMPVWGQEYTDAAMHYYSQNYNPEGFARAKILALIEYIYRLQAN